MGIDARGIGGQFPPNYGAEGTLISNVTPSFCLLRIFVHMMVLGNAIIAFQSGLSM